MRQVIEFYDYGSPPVVYAPNVNVDSILTVINSADFNNNRFGVRKDLLVNKHDGHFYELEDGMLLWKLKIQANNASSISFQASKLILPESAEMYVHNNDNKMIMGPITNQVIHDSFFASDLISGQNIVLSVKLRKVEKHEFNIQINYITIGVVERSNRGFGDSAPCNESMNVRCPDYNAWNNYKDAVCLILTSEAELATGSLLNTDCIEYRAYVLTAKHILNNNEPIDLIFRFNYESTTCDPPTEPRSWISFSGSTLLASWISTDFALLQMNGNLFGHTQLGLSGWDRSDNVPNTWSNFIHHPNADVKKIALNWEGGFLETEEKFMSQGGSLAPSASIRHQWNHTLLDNFGVPYPASEGVMQPGSSGAPMYSQFNGRIIAQHSASSMQGNCDSIIHTWSGRFHNSWLGGGTLNSSLDFWLGYNYNPTTADFVRVPGISGLDIICSGSTYNYSFVNPPPNRLNRYWTVSPSGYFSGSTSGTGTSATLTPLPSASGLATMTFTMAGDLICNDLHFTKKIWVGKPPHGVITVLGLIGDIEMCTEGIYTISYSHVVPGVTNVNYNWSVPGFLTILSGQGTQDITVQTPAGWSGYMQNYGTVSITVTNQCGQTVVNKPVSVKYCGEGGGPLALIDLHPNPTESYIHIGVGKVFSNVSFDNVMVKIQDLNGRTVYQSSITSDNQVIDVKSWPSGVYIVTLESPEESYTSNFIKK